MHPTLANLIALLVCAVVLAPASSAADESRRLPSALTGRRILFVARHQYAPDHHSTAYGEAVELIEAGRTELARRPRADMPGFTPAPLDLSRQRKAEALRRIEQEARRAILDGQKFQPGQLSPQQEGAP